MGDWCVSMGKTVSNTGKVLAESFQIFTSYAESSNFFPGTYAEKTLKNMNCMHPACARRVVQSPC